MYIVILVLVAACLFQTYLGCFNKLQSPLLSAAVRCAAMHACTQPLLWCQHSHLVLQGSGHESRWHTTAPTLGVVPYHSCAGLGFRV